MKNNFKAMTILTLVSLASHTILPSLTFAVTDEVASTQEVIEIEEENTTVDSTEDEAATDPVEDETSETDETEEDNEQPEIELEDEMSEPDVSGQEISEPEIPATEVPISEPEIPNISEPEKDELVSSAIEKFSFAAPATEQGQNFIDEIAMDAHYLSKKNGLYASVMIAQAYLESSYGSSDLSKAPYYNLFGIKGSYNGKSVSMKTMEQDEDGNEYEVITEFRVYPSYKESLEDYVDLIKGDGSANYLYAGVWKENAVTYQDATAALTGVYATDVDYNRKLNGIIESNNLTKYDGQKFSEAGPVKLSRQKLPDEYKSGLSLSSELRKRVTESEGEWQEIEDIQPEKVLTSEFTLPLNNYQVTSEFGPRSLDGVTTYNHYGIDLAAPMNTEVGVVKDGVVVESGYDDSKGYYVVVLHEDGYYTSYFHLNEILTTAGKRVVAGELIGLVGTTGDSTGPHLHFAVSVNQDSDYLDPDYFFNF